jgi:hypothetical protein
MIYSTWLKSILANHRAEDAFTAVPEQFVAAATSFIQPLPTDCLLLKCGSLLGQTLFNHHAEPIGMLSNIVLDLGTGRISYAVLAFPISFGCPARLFALPWHALVRSADQQHFVVEVERSELQRLSGFDPCLWPAHADPVWQRKIDGFCSSN